MPFSNDQQEPNIPITGSENPSSSVLLPKFFRTTVNQKFLSATVDQLISKSQVDQINAFLGRRTSVARKAADWYIEGVTQDRASYQLEPAILSSDDLGNVEFYRDYIDYLNQLRIESNSTVLNQNAINSQEYYAWDPHFDLDKFANYREYYWLPNGPMCVTVSGQSENVISTYSVTISQEGDSVAYVFSPDGLTRNPDIQLFRGQTYRFNVNCPGHPIAFKLIREANELDFISTGITKFDNQGREITDNWISEGTIEFTVPSDAPNIFYYVSRTGINASGSVDVFDITENTSLNVDLEIVGKKTYTDANSVSLSNGMKIRFSGQVIPEKYVDTEWYVDGVGGHIVLLPVASFNIPTSYTEDEYIEFDNEHFDSQGYDANPNAAIYKEYITINRGSQDRNPWSLYNRWFHSDVIRTSAQINGVEAILKPSARASRPIIEFQRDLKLFNFGTTAKQPVDLVDDYTVDVFSTIEGAIGYNIDGTGIIPGHRIMFLADPDPRVYGKIYQVAPLRHLNTNRLVLIEEPDGAPNEGDCVLAMQGTKFRGKMFYFSQGTWHAAQEKTHLNQKPKFDMFDVDGISYGDLLRYNSSTFTGTELFGYVPGTVYDSELGFNIQYGNVAGVGDIEFGFWMQMHSFTHQVGSDVHTISLDQGFLKLKNQLVNGWTVAPMHSHQPIVTTLIAESDSDYVKISFVPANIAIDEYLVRVSVNGLQVPKSDYLVVPFENDGTYVFKTPAFKKDDVLTISVSDESVVPDNSSYYSFPINFERNPENSNIGVITFGEVFNHILSAVDNCQDFVGKLTGSNNLRDLGSIEHYGTKIVQHSAPIPLSMFHITHDRYNIFKSLDFCRREYSKFKKLLINTASDLGLESDSSTQLDAIIEKIALGKPTTDPFYFSDMIPFGSCFVFDQTVIDDSITTYPLTFSFNLDVVSNQGVLVYLNGQQLIYDIDYRFVSQEFVTILKPLTAGDQLRIKQYQLTSGSCVPPTPSKLGIYPLFKPVIRRDTSYQNPVNVVVGHDGSITKCYNDYRDQILLEFETRVFNNTKIRYDRDYFNLHDLVPGASRQTSISRQELNRVIRKDFLHWSAALGNDYTQHDFYQSENPFTFNYNQFSTITDEKSPGFWRGIYHYYYDTDTPNLTPWEMLGFYSQPDWWEEKYGPAPYTSDNLILWSDLEKGVIRILGDSYIDSRYARPGLLSRIPVDSQGNLVPPVMANTVKNFNAVEINREFVFGDWTPTESAWRKSSEFPYSLISALCTLAPSEIFSKCFDRSRQTRNHLNQLVYNTDGNSSRISLRSLEIPDYVNEGEPILASGLVNFVHSYSTFIGSGDPSEYETAIHSIQVKLASKLAGFTSKDSISCILDSRTPTSSQGVFVPEESYDITLNTSAPVSVITYSGVTIEKSSKGFIIRGYSPDVSEFLYVKPISTATDVSINIGGISESFVEWDPNQRYTVGTLVRTSGNRFFRTSVEHVSSNTFEQKYFTLIANLPITGGRDILLRKRFETEPSSLHYGSVLPTVQEVCDFLVGYGAYLESQGFRFKKFNPELNSILDWRLSSKEFAFWTTQNWSEGAVISLSPASTEIVFEREYAIVGDLTDPRYEYSVLAANGKAIEPVAISSSRISNTFTLIPVEDTDAIFHVVLHLVQKEHVLLLENTTIFNDVIYHPVHGSRQERIKVVGTKTSGWNGGFTIPGFIYDQATTVTWKPWVDYSLGQSVKYKERYYSAKTNVPGSEVFDENSWYLNSKKPEAGLIPNWETKTSQTTEYYDPNVQHLDSGQQMFAQHLIGYQKRDYLESILPGYTSQFKFYQGMIHEKGTAKVIKSLFGSPDDPTNSLEFYEEWALRTGQYGAVDGFKEVEFLLDETKFFIDPQPVELVSTIDTDSSDLVYRITPNQVYVTTKDYTHDPFPLTDIPASFINTGGFVSELDVDLVLGTIEELDEVDIHTLQEGNYIWIIDTKPSWGVFRFSQVSATVTQVISNDQSVIIKFARNPAVQIQAGDYIGINDYADEIDGFHQVLVVSDGQWEIARKTNKDYSGNLERMELFQMSPRRVPSIDELHAVDVPSRYRNEKVWVGEDTGRWSVLENQSRASSIVASADSDLFGTDFDVTQDDTKLAVSDGVQVFWYTRESSKVEWNLVDQITPVSNRVYYFNLATSVNPAFLETDSSVLHINYFVDGQSDPITEIPGFDFRNLILFINEKELSSSSFTGSSIRIECQIVSDINENDIGVIETITLSRQGSRIFISSSMTNVARLPSFSQVKFGLTGDLLVLSDPDYQTPGYHDSTGIASIYKFNGTYFDFAFSIVPNTGHTEINFGKFIGFWNDAIIIASSGSSTEAGILGIYDSETGELAASIQLETGSEIRSLEVSTNLIFITVNNQVLIYAINYQDVENSTLAVQDEYLGANTSLVVNPNANLSDNYLVDCSNSNLSILLIQTIDVPDIELGVAPPRFGSSLAYTNGRLLIGMPGYSLSHSNQGAVVDYQVINNAAVYQRLILEPNPTVGSEFGSFIKINSTGTRFLVSSNKKSYFNPVIIDEETTTVDLGTTTFSDENEYSGTVSEFELYGGRFVFSGTLKASLKSVSSKKYGKTVRITNNAYINDIGGNSGFVHQFPITDQAWKVTQEFKPIPDVAKIKRAMLYDTETGSILGHLSIIDVLQGSIIGIVEQELDYKLPYDPATYKIGNGSVTTDEHLHWAADHVGEIWWDLTAVKCRHHYLGGILDKTSIWNKPHGEMSDVVYEWVASSYLPADWDKLADTDAGLTQGISGKSLYGNNGYSYTEKYDSISQNFYKTYYFWVKGRTIASGRLSVRDMSSLILDPASSGLPIMAVLDKNQFALYNTAKLITNKKVAINFQYWTSADANENIHRQFQLIAEGDPAAILNPIIERKWVDSLVGENEQGLPVPDQLLPLKLRYGILNDPRQSMFINRTEALKQLITKVNTLMSSRLIPEQTDLSDLFLQEVPPNTALGRYDLIVENTLALQSTNVIGFAPGKIEVVVTTGSITDVRILNPGKGYGKLFVTGFNEFGDPDRWVGPTVVVSGTGFGGQISTVVDERGSIVGTVIKSKGSGYQSATASIRPFTVLVERDRMALDKWSLYELTDQKKWKKTQTQSFNTSVYWEYVDWYQNTNLRHRVPTFQVDHWHQIENLGVRIGDLVKIRYNGDTGWTLLQKTQDSNLVSNNFSVIGKEKGTLRFKSTLYEFIKNSIGFDGLSYDTDVYDNRPVKELRFILSAIKNQLLTGDYRVEYNKLFFSSLRYVFSEQKTVDWAIKTSFITIDHKIGELTQPNTFQSILDKQYEEFINEVKPYRTKIRQYVNSYSSNNVAYTTVDDFDLENEFPENFRVVGGQIVDVTGNELDAITSTWIRSSGSPLASIEVVNPGTGYIGIPQVVITGESQVPARAVCNISGSFLHSITLEATGSGYLTVPNVQIIGELQDDGIPASVVAYLDHPLARSFDIELKFDRVGFAKTISQLTVTDTFTSEDEYPRLTLTFPALISLGTYFISINGGELLDSEFTLENSINQGILETTVQFTDPVVVGSLILITYQKHSSILDANERIEYFYNPIPGMLGKHHNQLMTGVDYSGTVLTGGDFAVGSGWDSSPWYTTKWDDYDQSYSEFVVISDGQTRVISLPYIPTIDDPITVYLNGTRIDDIDYGTVTQSNPDALMETIIGDGSTPEITIPNQVPLEENDRLIFRKYSSDGSYSVLNDSYDTILDGGDLLMSTAMGVLPSDILVDGGTLTPSTINTTATEELIPGNTTEAIDITVVTQTPIDATFIQRSLWVADGETTEFVVDIAIGTEESTVVNINNEIIPEDQYTLDLEDGVLSILSPLEIGDTLELVSVLAGYDELLAAKTAVISNNEILTDIPFDVDAQAILLINGEIIDSQLESYNTGGADLIKIELANPVVNGTPCYFQVGIGESKRTLGITHVWHHNADPMQQDYAVNSLSSLLVSDDDLVVFTDGHVLASSEVLRFVVSGNSRTYIVTSNNHPVTSLGISDLEVFRNHQVLTPESDFTWVPGSQELKLKRGVANPGDSITIKIVKDSEFTLDRSTGSTVLTTNTALNQNLTVVLIEPLKSSMKNNESLLQIQEVDITTWYDKKTVLPFAVQHPSMIWINKNGNELVSGTDFTLDQSGTVIEFTVSPNNDDEITAKIVERPTLQNQFGYRMFKSTLGETSYIRLSDRAHSTLQSPLTITDDSIEVTDPSALPIPSNINNRPGVIFINGERIEYLVKIGNKLSQIRRATGGTGAANSYLAGTAIWSGHQDQAIPYRDTVRTVKVTTAGYNESDNLLAQIGDLVIDRVELIDRNTQTVLTDQTATMLGGETIRITGQGFNLTDIVTMTIGGVIGSVTVLDTETATATLPALTIGVYSLSVQSSSNGITKKSFIRDAVTYSKIPISWTPIKSQSQWQSDLIPDGYGQCDHLEVFVAGSRLVKSEIPIVVENQHGILEEFISSAGFSVDGINDFVRITDVPSGVRVNIVIKERSGTSWVAGMGDGRAEDLFVMATTAQKWTVE